MVGTSPAAPARSTCSPGAGVVPPWFSLPAKADNEDIEVKGHAYVTPVKTTPCNPTCGARHVQVHARGCVLVVAPLCMCQEEWAQT